MFVFGASVLKLIGSITEPFISNIRNQGQFDVVLLQQIVGHEISKAGTTDKYTHRTEDLNRLLEVVNSFHFKRTPISQSIEV